MLLLSAVVFGTGGASEAEANEEKKIWYLAAVACHGSSSSSNTGFAAVVCRGSSSCNDLTAEIFLTSINVAPMLSFRPGRRDSSNRSCNRHGESLRSALVRSTTAGATPYTSRWTHLPRQAHQCVRCTTVAVAANMGTSPNIVLHRVGLRAFAAPAASMVTYGGAALSVDVGNLI